MPLTGAVQVEYPHSSWDKRVFPSVPERSLYSKKYRDAKQVRPPELKRHEVQVFADATRNTVWVDANGRPLAVVLPFGSDQNEITTRHLECLTTAYKKLLASGVEIFKPDGQRGTQQRPWNARHLGTWCWCVPAVT